MEIILSSHCKSLHGCLDKSHGYVVRQTPSGKFVGVRKPGQFPADGHLRFIFDLAEMANSGLLVMDIKVDWRELQNALYVAKCFTASEQVRRDYVDMCKATYNAKEVLAFKERVGL